MKCVNPSRVQVFSKDLGRNITVLARCRKCLECQIHRRHEWSMRIMHEIQDKQACMITLTYDDDHVPSGLVRKDVVDFNKRVRIWLQRNVSRDKKVKFFYAGEYGDKTARPHYHIIIMGWKPDDMVPHSKSRKGSVNYTSETLSKLWKFGFAVAGNVTHKTCAYVAGYLCKNSGPVRWDTCTTPKGFKYVNQDWINKETGEYCPPFQGCSQGIGRAYAERYAEEMINRNACRYEHRDYSIPAYYVKVIKEMISKFGVKLQNWVKMRLEECEKLEFPTITDLETFHHNFLSRCNLRSQILFTKFSADPAPHSWFAIPYKTESLQI